MECPWSSSPLPAKEEDMVKNYNLGANSYLRKPVEFDQFLDATKQLDTYWLLLNEVPPAE
jgi:two-component system response regulator